MANDQTMPPSEQNLPPDMGKGPASPADMAPPAGMPAPQDGGSVMITMPKAALDAIRELVVQLASGVDQLAQGVNQQAAGGSPEGAPMPPESPESAPSPEAGGGDDDFLKSIAQEGNARTK